MSLNTKIALVHPGGGCGNYILMNLCKIDITHCLAYHDHGTHGIRNNNGIYDIRYLPTSDDVKAILIVTNRYHLDIDKISNYNTSVSQVHIDTFNELVVLNWFLKHTGSIIESWENEQKKHWHGRYALEKAVCYWTTKMFDENFVDIKRIPEIEKTFSFSSLYKNYNTAKKEFSKFDVEYREDTHKKFIVSQKPVLDRWQKILSIYKENPLSLEEYFTKGIALALHQKEFNLSKEELYDKFNLN